MQYMFAGCKSLKSLDLSDFDISMVTDMTCRFKECSLLEYLDIRNFKPSSLDSKYLYQIFEGCISLENIVMETEFYNKAYSFIINLPCYSQ